MIHTTRRAALYARFSSSNQREESIDAQMRAMEDHCKRNNITIVRKYIDRAQSGTTAKRQNFQRMIEDSKNREFDIVLVHKLDRFARNRFDSAIYQHELKKNGVTLYSVLENLDDSPQSVVMQSVLEGFAEYYSKSLSLEVMKGMTENALKAISTGGISPLGYDVDPKTRKYVINEKEAEAVRIIFSMYAKGYGYSAIMDELNDKGFTTKTGKHFTKSGFYSILTNPKYNGTYVYNRRTAKAPDGTRNNHTYKDYSDMIIIEGGCPRIVDDETFKAVARRIEENKHKGGRVSKHEKEQYLLTGRVRCMDCNHSMAGNMRLSGRNKEKYVTYRCPTNRKFCSNKEISRDYLERYTIYLLETHIFNSKALGRIKKNILKYSSTAETLLEQDYSAIDAEIARNAEELKNIADAVAAGLLSSALVERLNRLEEEKQELADRRSRLASLAQNPTTDIDTGLILSEYAALRKTPSNPEYKTFISSFIDHIEVGRYTIVFVLKTGLDIYPSLDTSITVRRQEIYEYGKKATTA